MSNEFTMMDNMWKEFSLSDLVDCLDGARRPIKKEDRENIAGGYPYYGASGIIDFVNNYLFDEELILLGEDGENVVSRNLPLAFKITGKNWVNNHAHVLKPKRNHDIDFLVYKLESRDYTDIITGSAQPKINQQNLMKLIFRIPEHLQEQQQIAKILSTADAVIEKTQAAIDKYKALKQGMLHDLFTRGIDIFTGKLRPKYEDAPDLYKESKLGMIPKEWEVNEFGKKVDLVHGHQFRNYDFTDFGIPVVKIGQVKPENVDLSNCSFVDFGREEEFKNEVINNGDVLMALTGATLGKACLVSGLNGIVLQNYRVGRFEPIVKENDIDKVFLYYLLIAGELLTQIFSKVNSGAQGNVGKSDFEKATFKKPPFKEQMILAEKLTAIDKKLQAEQNYLFKLQKIKNGLMGDLLSGRNRVVVKED